VNLSEKNPKNLFESFSHLKLLLILLGISYFSLMFGNGILSLTHPDEVFYTQTTKEMIQHQSWLTPYIFDEPQFEKPIMFFWLMIAAVKAFGLNPFTARLIPSLFGIIGVGVTYWLGWMIFRRKTVGFLSAFVLSTSSIYLALSRSVLTDMTFSILVVISIGFFYLGMTDEDKRTRGLILGFVFSGLAVLTKGLLGFLFPFLTMILFVCYKRDFSLFKHKGMFWGIIVFLVIAAPWHIEMYRQYGQGFINEYWSNVHVR